jgi:hypothetical protein
VAGSERYGIAVFPTARFVSFAQNAPEPGPPWRPRGNRVTRNVVTRSGIADLALAKGSGRGNCFTRNVVGRTLPRGVQTPSCATLPDGDGRVAADLTRRVRVMVAETLRRRRPPPHATMPAPPAQPNMPGA